MARVKGTLTGTSFARGAKSSLSLIVGPQRAPDFIIFTVYTLTASAGSVTIAGSATTMPRSYSITASSGSVGVAGSLIVQTVGRAITVDPGQISILGFDISVVVPTHTGLKFLPNGTGADQYGFNPFPGRYPFYDFYPGPLTQWKPYMNDVMIAYDYATQLFVGLKDKTGLLALGAAGIGPRS